MWSRWETMKTGVVALAGKSSGAVYRLIEWTTQTRQSSDSEWALWWWILPDVTAPAVLTQLGVTRASASQGACRPSLDSCPHGYAGAGLTETETTQALQSGTNRVYGTAEQPSSHSLHHVSGSLAFTGFVGRKIWVYVCTYNIWQQGGIQIQLRRMLFAWVTVLAVDLFQRPLLEKVFCFVF